MGARELKLMVSADGRDFVLVHTKNDRWASIEGRFELADSAAATSNAVLFRGSSALLRR